MYWLIVMEVEPSPMEVPMQWYLKILYFLGQVPILYRDNFTAAYEGIDGNSTLQRGADVWRSDSVVTGVRIHVTVIGRKVRILGGYGSLVLAWNAIWM